MRILALTTVACCLALPLLGQETARDELRDLTYEEESDRVLSHLVSFLPHARDAAQFEAAVDHWVADLSPADIVSVRHRIHELLREVPARDLYGVLLAIVRHRARDAVNETEIMRISSASSQCRPSYFLISGRCCRGGGHQACYNPSPVGPSPTPRPNHGTPSQPPVQSWQIISSVGGQLHGAAGNCSALRQLSQELAGATCTPGNFQQQATCRNARFQVWTQLDQLLRAANC